MTKPARREHPLFRKVVVDIAQANGHAIADNEWDGEEIDVISDMFNQAVTIGRLECKEPVDTAQALLTALNVGDVKSGSALHIHLRKVMIEHRSAQEKLNEPS